MDLSGSNKNLDANFGFKPYQEANRFTREADFIGQWSNGLNSNMKIGDEEITAVHSAAAYKEAKQLPVAVSSSRQENAQTLEKFQHSLKHWSVLQNLASKARGAADKIWDGIVRPVETRFIQMESGANQKLTSFQDAMKDLIPEQFHADIDKKAMKPSH